MNEIVISFDPATGQLAVQHPENEIVCYGLMELAKRAIADNFSQRKRITKIQPVNGHLA